MSQETTTKLFFMGFFLHRLAQCAMHMPIGDFGPTDHVQYDPSITTVITWVFFQRLIFSNLLSVSPHNIWWSISNACTRKKVNLYHAVYALTNPHFKENTHEIKVELVTCLSDESYFNATKIIDSQLPKEESESLWGHGSQPCGIPNFPCCNFDWANPFPGQ